MAHIKKKQNYDFIIIYQQNAFKKFQKRILQLFKKKSFYYLNSLAKSIRNQINMNDSVFWHHKILRQFFNLLFS